MFYFSINTSKEHTFSDDGSGIASLAAEADKLIHLTADTIILWSLTIICDTLTEALVSASILLGNLIFLQHLEFKYSSTFWVNKLVIFIIKCT